MLYLIKIFKASTAVKESRVVCYHNYYRTSSVYKYLNYWSSSTDNVIHILIVLCGYKEVGNENICASFLKMITQATSLFRSLFIPLSFYFAFFSFSICLCPTSLIAHRITIGAYLSRRWSGCHHHHHQQQTSTAAAAENMTII